ncbi:MAG: OmpA family protein [Saprospiraceae bacterium]|nr:OmpA family protein [Saprospiraceae bacterium]
MKQYRTRNIKPSWPLTFTCLLFTVCLWSQSYQYLGGYDELGFPSYLEENEEIDSSVLTLIQTILPERVPLPDRRPELINGAFDSDLHIVEKASLWVTFFHEEAGYKNVLGFYTYDINNPPTSKPAPEEITIIFPNASRKGSGGSLVSGSRVKIGTFEPGTGIGWVLFSNGWRSAVTPGNWELYSNANFNTEKLAKNRAHSVSIYNPSLDNIILGFEDLSREHPVCDHDFNDVLFFVSADPPSAIQKANLIDTERALEEEVVEVPVEAAPELTEDVIEEGALIRLSKLYYNFDKASIRADATEDLDELVRIMKKYPDMTIAISSHTDSRGNESYNLNLSKNRAKSVVDYLAKKGLDPKRISSEGYGEAKLLNECADGVSCSEEQHQFNRRTEVRIVELGAAVEVEYNNNGPKTIDKMPGSNR